MNIFGEDGPEFKGNRVDKELEQKIAERKSAFLKHFMVDYLELSLRKVVQ